MKKNKWLKKGIALAVFTVGMQAQAGIPTIDGAVVGTTQSDLIQTITQYARELHTWKKEAADFKQMTTALKVADLFTSGSLPLKDMDFLGTGGDFQKIFGDPQQYLTGLVSKGLNGLSTGTQNFLNQHMPEMKVDDKDKDTAKADIINDINKQCRLAAGLDVEIRTLDETNHKFAENATKSMQETAEKITGSGDSGKENASYVGSVETAVSVKAEKLRESQEQYKTTRAELVNKRDQAYAECNTARSKLVEHNSNSTGFTSAITPLIFGGAKKADNKSFSTKGYKSRDPRFK